MSLDQQSATIPAWIRPGHDVFIRQTLGDMSCGPYPCRVVSTDPDNGTVEVCTHSGALFLDDPQSHVGKPDTYELAADGLWTFLFGDREPVRYFLIDPASPEGLDRQLRDARRAVVAAAEQAAWHTDLENIDLAASVITDKLTQMRILMGTSSRLERAASGS